MTKSKLFANIKKCPFYIYYINQNIIRKEKIYVSGGVFWGIIFWI
ncbi:hypothetical protein DCCM_2471 [Desulfocucumis palustris]|uniref:Uncharacterized protein n=1 Tax=Desulfocucumis palustris TaxID=1898651 RepID=A0A2L2XB93_9FIRM|nr:hypothetical protein DCCM_2471 [Desulfocucumis palustris]